MTLREGFSFLRLVLSFWETVGHNIHNIMTKFSAEGVAIKLYTLVNTLQRSAVECMHQSDQGRNRLLF